MDKTTPTSSNDDFEGTKARKLYAQLSLDQMMGSIDPNIQPAMEPVSDENVLQSGNNERFFHHPDDEFTSDEDDEYLDGEDDDDELNEHLDGQSTQLNGSHKSQDAAYSPCSSFLVYNLATVDIQPPPDSSTVTPKTIEACINEIVTENGNTIVNTASQVILQITDGSIVLIDLKTKQLMKKIDICHITSWAAVDRDFAFVTASDITTVDGENSSSRDSYDVTVLPNQLEACAIASQTSTFKCHIFRCEDDGLESAAVTISTLLEKERLKTNNVSDGFYIEDDYLNPQSSVSTPDVEFFPTPVEEPCKTIRAIFLGSTVVKKPSGIDVLNDAIDSVVNELHHQKGSMSLPQPSNGTNNSDDEESHRVETSPHQRLLNSKTWTLSPCDVKISPSTVLITAAISGEPIIDARLRYISFMGISKSDVRKCAFILRTGECEFTAFILQCDPDAGLLCRTLETACKMRFQKCMDAHRLRSSASTDASTSNRTFGVFKRSTSLQAVKKAITNVLWSK